MTRITGINDPLRGLPEQVMGDATRIEMRAFIDTARARQAGSPEVAAPAKKAASKKPAPFRVHEHLQGHPQLTHTGTDEKKTVGRYVKKGFYDGDHPNAHQTLKTETVHTYTGPHEAKESLHKALKGAGYSHTGFKFRGAKAGQEAHHYAKGQHYVSITKPADPKKPIVVHHTSTKTAPDREFERSGRGRGQLI